jgi:hypothetical protein
MKFETQSLSLDQPDQVLSILLKTLQQMLSTFKARAVKKMPDYRNILIIDDDERRSQLLSHLLVKAGYRPFVMANALEAFTRFLQVPFVPFAIILSQDDTSNKLFLQRLLQQTQQKYEWEIPLIRLNFESTSSMLRTSSPQLSPLNSFGKPLSQTSLPQSSNVLNPSLQSGSMSQEFPQSSALPYMNTPTQNYPPLSPQAPLTTPQSDKLPPLSQSFSGSFLQEAYSSGASPITETPRSETKEVQRISLEDQNLGRYHVYTPLGDSKTSNVYRTYDRLREQDVALKAFQTNAIPYHVMEHSLEEYNLFQQEADLLRGMEHPHIVTVWASGKSYVSGVSFIYKTMVYCPEGSLAQWLFKHSGSRVFTPRDVAHVISQLADALQYLHDQQITFQNFKLSNLLVKKPAKTMSQLHLMLVDFAVPQDGTFFPKSQESMAYIAPERWNGEVSPASDQYGLAVIAYELLTGRLPFQGTSEHVMKLLHTSMQPQSPSIHNPSLSAAVNNVILRALAKKPNERFASVSQFAKTFQKYCI